MRRFFIAIVFLLFPASLIPSNAQEAVEEPYQIGKSGEDYLRSIRLRGVDPDVTYFDPSAPAPDLDTEQQPERPQEDKKDKPIETGRWTTGLIAGALLLAIGYMFLRFGGGLTVSLGRNSENPGRDGPRKPSVRPDWAERTGTFDEILRIEDRRRALVLLMHKALAAMATANGVLMQRSWTARDALRHIPGDQTHRDILRSLVLASELVQFGGRDITEDEFRTHVGNCRQLLGPGVT
ncbi:DUF4129 domain-containing protein [Roseibium sp.]|uniref:DUF4129 domain-containing protein n=2 Tax=Roseibium sp. TaxID=1936156 RepID=UPI003D0FD0EC